MGDKMTTFEEQFPSLREHIIDNGFCAESSWTIRVPLIKEHCLDKSKVKEAIEKANYLHIMERSMLLKELGLV
jgi:hypothetical protein